MSKEISKLKSLPEDEFALFVIKAVSRTQFIKDRKISQTEVLSKLMGTDWANVYIAIRDKLN